MLTDRTNPVGTWRVKITAASDTTFEEPAVKGEGIGAQGFGDEVRAQTLEGLLILEPEHTCLCLMPGPGAGTSQSEGPSAISFDFAELINYHADGGFTGYVKVTQQGTVSADGDAFTSSGQGVVRDANGTHITITRTTTQVTRLPELANASRKNLGLGTAIRSSSPSRLGLGCGRANGGSTRSPTATGIKA